jgi:ribonuclease P protein component
MTPSLRRLRKRREFLQVARARRSWVTPGLVLQARRRPAAAGGVAAIGPAAPNEPRDIGVGLTASKKVGSAVRRNRARRRLRALAAEILPVSGTPGTDYVLIARAGTLSRTYIGLTADLRDALAKLKVKAPRREKRGTGRV